MRNFKDFRVSHQMTQETLAKRLRISQPHLALLESGRRDPSQKVMLRFDALLGSSKKANLVPDVAAKKILNDLNELHLKDSILYLESYLRDCESQLHRKQKALDYHLDKYNHAIVENDVRRLSNSSCERD